MISSFWRVRSMIGVSVTIWLSRPSKRIKVNLRNYVNFVWI